MNSGCQLAKAPAGTTRVIIFDAYKPSAVVGGSGVIQKLRQAHRHQESPFRKQRSSTDCLSLRLPGVDCGCYINGLVSLGPLIF